MYFQEAYRAKEHCLRNRVEVCGLSSAVFTHDLNPFWYPSRLCNYWNSPEGIFSVLPYISSSKLRSWYMEDRGSLSFIKQRAELDETAWIIMKGNEKNARLGHMMSISRQDGELFLWDTAASEHYSSVDAKEVMERALTYFTGQMAYYIRF